jgi:hypothetical protein
MIGTRPRAPKVRSFTIALAVAAAGWVSARAWAQTLPPPEELPRATPVITIDDLRTHGPVARNWIDGTVDAEAMNGNSNNDAVFGLNEQIALGRPEFQDRQLRDILAPAAPYSLRVRSHTFFSHERDAQQGPLTAAVQRYFPVDPVAISPLVFAHVGLEAAASTPWLSGRNAVPPSTVAIVNAVDTELADNGWSLRPISGYLRGDFLACGSRYVEVGATPEMFVPTVGPNQYDLRFRVAGGWSWGCGNTATGFRPKLSLEYRGRVRLHADDEPVAYWDSIGIGLQFDLGPVVLEPLATTVLAHHFGQYGMLALRFQLGCCKRPS